MRKGLRRSVGIFILINAVFICMVLIQPEETVSVAGKPEGVALPVIMYHQLSGNYKNWNDYVISPEKFEADIELLNSMGYTPVSAQQLIAYTGGRGTLPQKPLLITFDDGDENFYKLAWPIIKKHSIPVVLSPVAEWVEEASTEGEKASKPYITFEQAQEMEESGLVEIENHTYNLHSYNRSRKGVLNNHGEPLQQYRKAIMNDLEKAQSLWRMYLGQSPVVFTYPYGFFNDQSELVIRALGFKITLTCNEKVNRVSEPESLYLLGRYNRSNSLSSEGFIGKINKLVEAINKA